MVDIVMCSSFIACASGVCTSPLVNTLGDHVLFGPHEALPFHLCVRGIVYDHVKTVKHCSRSHIHSLNGPESDHYIVH